MSIFPWTRSPGSPSCARFLFKLTPASFLVLLIFISPTSTTHGASVSDEVGMYGSIAVAREAREAAVAMKQNNFALAQGKYKLLIGMQPDEDDFYFGIYESSRKMGQWQEVGGALNQLFLHAPKYKDKMSQEYGECLYHLNRYDEAEEAMKLALARISEPPIIEKQLRKLYRKSIIKHTPVVGPIVKPIDKSPIEPVKPPPLIPEEQYHPHTSNVDLNLETAYEKSECVLIASYKKYEQGDGMTTFYNPPKAIFRIKKILKGPPLNPTLPLRYEFHDKTSKPKPKGWKFDPKKMMPKKGSDWIIFIQNAVPVERMFESYHGSWGRIPFTENNIDKILNIKQQHRGQS